MKTSTLLKRAEKLHREARALRKQIEFLDESRKQLLQSTIELEEKMKVLKETKK